MKKVLALVLSLVLMLGGSAAALAETAQSIPPLSQISSNPNSATFTWRSDVSTQDVEKKEICYTEIGITKRSSTSVSIIKVQTQMQKLQQFKAGCLYNAGITTNGKNMQHVNSIKAIQHYVKLHILFP